MGDYLVEYNLKPGDPGFSPKPVVHTGLMGGVTFVPNPRYADRLVVECPTQKAQDELLQNGNLGIYVGQKRVLVTPDDLLGQREEARVRALVEEVVNERASRGGRPPKLKAEEVREAVVEVLNEVLPGLVLQLLDKGNGKK